MKRIIKVGLLLTLIPAAFLNSNKCYSQIAELGRFMAAGAGDAQVLLQSYITPAVNGFGAALSGGWYNTAKTHKLGGFDLTFTANAAIIPKKYETFEIDDTQLSFLKLADPGNKVSQTVAGADKEGPLLAYSYDEYAEPAFHMPGGLDSKYIPAPMVQAGIGLWKGTEVMVRYFPNIDISDNEFGLWGIGGKHDIKQWIPGLKILPVLQLSVMYGYTRLHTYIDMNIDKDAIGASSLPGEEGNIWMDQYMKLIVQSQTANLLVAADLPVVCFYGSLGFVTTKTNLKFTGEFPMVDIVEGIPTVRAMADPVDIEIKNQDGGITKPRFNAGVRLKLAFVTLHVDYSWANYSVLTGGLGISFN
jgi:hypothetical protein